MSGADGRDRTASGRDTERFPVEPWAVREVGLDPNDPDDLARVESLFALSNGHIGVRGNLDEGDPNGLPGTYLNSFYETRPLPYAEAGYGYPESGQTVLSVTNGKLLRLHVDDEPVDLRYGTILEHTRTLDLRRGVLQRQYVWCSPAGTRVRVSSTRLVSLVRRSLLAIRYRVEPVDSPLRAVVQSELVANETLPAQSADPRAAAAIKDPLEAVEHLGEKLRAVLMHRTRRSELTLAAAMNHVVEQGEPVTELDVQPDWARVTFSADLGLGEALELTKFVSYGWSSQRSQQALRDQVSAAGVSAVASGWAEVLAEQERQLASFWEGADVEIDGDDEVQQAVRFGIFHAYQAGARSEGRAIPAKGLTGPGYDGHAFWDTEMFVLPLLSATAPQAAAGALRWRADTLDLARERAATLHLAGAAFPWRTIRGQECSAYWPAGTAAFHVNAGISAAVSRHYCWTADRDFARDVGVPVTVETARLWCSLGYHGDDGRFHIDGVTGPDEYSAMSHDNVYTNLLAAQNLRDAAHHARRFPEQAAELQVEAEEIQAWEAAAEAMAVPFSERLGVHEQSRGFTDREVWDFAATARDGGYPLLLHSPYFDLYRKQVIKQADLVLALHWAGNHFTAEQKARAFAYCEALTVRDSSLSACTQAVVAAEVGQLELAAAYLAEAALMDLRDLEGNAKDGLHIASLAGGWLAVVAGFAGLRDGPRGLVFRPQLPPGWTRLAFSVRPLGQRLTVEITPGHVSYSAFGDEPITVSHISDGGEPEPVRIKPGHTQKKRWEPVPPSTPVPTQPSGRAPHRVG